MLWYPTSISWSTNVTSHGTNTIRLSLMKQIANIWTCIYDLYHEVALWNTRTSNLDAKSSFVNECKLFGYFRPCFMTCLCIFRGRGPLPQLDVCHETVGKAFNISFVCVAKWTFRFEGVDKILICNAQPGTKAIFLQHVSKYILFQHLWRYKWRNINFCDICW